MRVLLMRMPSNFGVHLLFNDSVLEELGAMVLGDEIPTRFV